MSANRGRHAFTLVELFVVMAVIGLLIALLLPAIHAAREAARNAQCRNNLKQIGSAAHSYLACSQTFPPGAVYGDWQPAFPYASWGIAVLPYLDQAALYDDYNQTVDNARNVTVTARFVAAFICPSDANTERLEVPFCCRGGDRAAPGSYRAVAGRSVDPVPVYMGVSDFYRFFYTINPEPNFGVNPPNDSGRGLMHIVGAWAHPSVAFNWVGRSERGSLNGLAKTLLVGERHTQTSNRRRTFWALGEFNLGQVFRERRTLLPDFDACAAAHPQGYDAPCNYAFGSLHSGNGLNWLLGDGSVQTTSPNIDLQILWNSAAIGVAELPSL